MALQTRKIFIDASIFVSFIDRADPNHPKAANAMESITRLGYTAFTSHSNITETYATLSREVGVSVALDFLQAILQSDIEIIFPQKADLIAAHRMIRANRDRQMSLREALSATLMQRRGITQVLTLTYWHNLLGTSTSGLAL